MAKQRSKGSQDSSTKRRRGQKPYPVVVFSEAFALAEGIVKHASCEPVRRLRLMELMDLNPNSRSARELITNSGKYGLTAGSHAADQLALTEKGREAVDPSDPARKRRQAAFDLAIAGAEPNSKFSLGDE